jgi:hypothetical protein
MMRLIFLLLGILASATAQDMLAPGEQTLTCTGIQGNECFENVSHWKYQMIQALVGEALSSDGRRLTGDPVDSSVDETIDSSVDASEMSNLRGSVERKASMCAWFQCNANPGSYVCGLYGCNRRAQEGCNTETFTMEELLEPYNPPSSLKGCLKDVECTLVTAC